MMMMMIMVNRRRAAREDGQERGEGGGHPSVNHNLGPWFATALITPNPL